LLKLIVKVIERDEPWPTLVGVGCGSGAPGFDEPPPEQPAKRTSASAESVTTCRDITD
jgi:hypothetical protein